MTYLIRDSPGLSKWKGKLLIKEFLCASMPVYRILFKLKFSTVSGHMIKCLLIEFGGAEQESIWLSVMKQGLQVVT